MSSLVVYKLRLPAYIVLSILLINCKLFILISPEFVEIKRKDDI